MIEENGYYIWKKGEKAKLGDFFNVDNFRCQCTNDTCSQQLMSKAAVDKVVAMREELGAPIWITSAYRCAKHQQALREKGAPTAKGTSTHELGHALDIRAKDMDMLLSLAEDHFKAIGVAKTFLHVDLRDDKKRSWTY